MSKCINQPGSIWTRWIVWRNKGGKEGKSMGGKRREKRKMRNRGREKGEKCSFRPSEW